MIPESAGLKLKNWKPRNPVEIFKLVPHCEAKKLSVLNTYGILSVSSDPKVFPETVPIVL
jgi:hypothetical protein